MSDSTSVLDRDVALDLAAVEAALADRLIDEPTPERVAIAELGADLRAALAVPDAGLDALDARVAAAAAPRKRHVRSRRFAPALAGTLAVVAVAGVAGGVLVAGRDGGTPSAVDAHSNPTAVASEQAASVPGLPAAREGSPAATVAAATVSASTVPSAPASAPALSIVPGPGRTVAPGGPGLPVPPIAPPAPGRGPFAPRQAERKVEQAARIALATNAVTFDDVTGGVIAATDDAGGFVVDATTTRSSPDSGYATFTLKVPTDRLPSALSAISGLADVESRSQSQRDVTQGFVTTTERLEEATARRRSLVRALAATQTDATRRAVTAQLVEANRRVAALRGDLRARADRVDYSTVGVTVSVRSDDGARPMGASTGGDESGPFSPSRALDVAGSILSVSAGVLIVTGAAVLPFVPFVVLAVVGARLLRRRARRRALDAS